MSGFIALLKNVGALADDTSALLQTTIKNTVTVLGDDLAVSAEKTSKFNSKRELKLIWDIVKGSLINKIIILPIIFLFSYFYPPLIKVALFLGGLYLSFEGVESILDFFHKKEKSNNSEENEQEQVQDAIKIDFILSIEIVIIALAATIGQPFEKQVIATTITAFIATFFVYGIVALIVRLDDFGIWLYNRKYKKIGKGLILFMPKIINILKYLGLFAMLEVGGGIIGHTLEIHNYFYITNIIISIIAGSIILLNILLYKKIKQGLS